METTKCMRLTIAMVLGLGGAASVRAPALAQAAESTPVMIAVVRVEGKFHFTPSPRNVKTGDTVQWVNLTEGEHTITALPDSKDKLVGTDSLEAETPESEGDQYSEVIDDPAGPINYRCEIHPGRWGCDKGVRTVERCASAQQHRANRGRAERL